MIIQWVWVCRKWPFILLNWLDARAVLNREWLARQGCDVTHICVNNKHFKLRITVTTHFCNQALQPNARESQLSKVTKSAVIKKYTWFTQGNWMTVLAKWMLCSSNMTKLWEGIPIKSFFSFSFSLLNWVLKQEDKTWCQSCLLQSQSHFNICAK